MNLPPLLPPDESARRAARSRWNACAHPLGGLGLLESMVEDMAALTGSPELSLCPRSLLVFCADNGIVAQGVSQCGREVTAAVARGLAEGTTPAGRMARIARCRVVPVDVGIRDFPGCPGVLDRRIRNGTGDISLGSAMTREEGLEAIRTGIRLVEEEGEKGTRLLAVGEMGIGNTSTAAAVTAALLELPVEELAGRGAGLSGEGLRRKREALKRALAVNAPDPGDPLDVLCKVGGLDIAALCGVCLGGALWRIPIVLDGAITGAAALCALRLCPQAGQALFASHLSSEPISALLLGELGKPPLLTAGMHLGEGCGALALLPLLDMALAVYQGAATFAARGISPYEPEEAVPCSP